MGITMQCNGCNATSLGGVLQHMPSCPAAKPEPQTGNIMPGITIKFDTPEDRQRFAAKLRGSYASTPAIASGPNKPIEQQYLDEPCPVCKGKGENASDYGSGATVECYYCDGTGKRPVINALPSDKPVVDGEDELRKQITRLVTDMTVAKELSEESLIDYLIELIEVYEHAAEMAGYEAAATTMANKQSDGEPLYMSLYKDEIAAHPEHKWLYELIGNGYDRFEVDEAVEQILEHELAAERRAEARWKREHDHWKTVAESLMKREQLLTDPKIIVEVNPKSYAYLPHHKEDK